jgi:hypothetical protein
VKEALGNKQLLFRLSTLERGHSSTLERGHEQYGIEGIKPDARDRSTGRQLAGVVLVLRENLGMQATDYKLACADMAL